MCGLVRRFEARPGPATAHGHHSLAPRPPTGAAGESRETVIAFAGVCSVSGETDDTIASQIHLFSAQFWRAKASWVSWRRPDVSALVSTVSSCGAVSSMGATKFAQCRLSMAIARKYSPSAGKMAQNGRFMACRASLFAEMAHMASRWASFFAGVGGWGVSWGNFGALRHLNQVPKPSIGTEAGPFHACMPSRPAKPAAYADRLLRSG